MFIHTLIRSIAARASFYINRENARVFCSPGFYLRNTTSLREKEKNGYDTYQGMYGIHCSYKVGVAWPMLHLMVRFSWLLVSPTEYCSFANIFLKIEYVEKNGYDTYQGMYEHNFYSLRYLCTFSYSKNNSKFTGSLLKVPSIIRDIANLEILIY
jgi:hypothetical protein